MQLVMPFALPPGMRYRPALVTAAEEASLLAQLEALPLAEVRMRGMVARRRTAHFGWSYEYGSARVSPGEPLPDFLREPRRRCAALAGVPLESLEEALVSWYPPGAGIGWHRDAPAFEVVVGISLGTACKLRLRRGDSGRASMSLELEPRSAYVFTGEAREQWQHHIPPVKTPRWSLTFRSIRAAARPS